MAVVNIKIRLADIKKGGRKDLYYLLTENSRVDFTAYAPMHTFKGWAIKGLTGSIKIDFDKLELRYIQVIQETGCLDTGKADRNKAMQDYFSLDNYPETSFTITECQEFCRLKDNNYRIIVLGILEFAGIRRQLPITCILKHHEERILLDLNFKWSFKAYGLKAPQLLFLRVRDIVDIKAHLEFTR